MDEKIKEIEERWRRSKCNCPWFEDAEKTRHLLGCQLSRTGNEQKEMFKDDSLFYLLSKIKELEDKLTVLQDHANGMGEIIHNQTMKRIELEGELTVANERIKELEKRIESAEATRDDALAYAKMYKEKVKELEHFITWGYPSDHFNLLVRVEKLEEGIENHHNKKLEIKRFFANISENHPQAQQIPDAVDEELYRLIREKP